MHICANVIMRFLKYIKKELIVCIAHNYHLFFKIRSVKENISLLVEEILQNMYEQVIISLIFFITKFIFWLLTSKFHVWLFLNHLEDSDNYWPLEFSALWSFVDLSNKNIWKCNINLMSNEQMRREASFLFAHLISYF